MKILSHRGLWYSDSDKNSIKSFEDSFSLGFGTETDIRDYQGKLVISHDIANRFSITLEDMLKIYCKYDKNLFLALNIKSDGLQSELKRILDQYEITNYFVFDMSVPEGIKYSKAGFNSFTRESEYERLPSFYNEASGVWVDCFKGDWIDEGVINKHLNNGKKVCVVSPDLHKRHHLEVWNGYKNLITKDNLFLCTDYPNQAKKFFNI
jgi:hypothetical protein